MKILIIGNIGSGKTTLGKKIQEFTDFKFIQIDELRVKYLKKKVSEEYYCLYKFLKAIEDIDNVILEFTGVGCHKYAIKRALELSDDIIKIILCLNREFKIIHKRIRNKNFKTINLFSIKPDEHINFIKDELKLDIDSEFWSISNSNLLSVYMDTADDLKYNVKLILEEI
jgi:adenylate kinase family enzyme